MKDSNMVATEHRPVVLRCGLDRVASKSKESKLTKRPLALRC